ncbi:pirin family protein [Paenibacillus flagellatus]|uniref:Pirin n=1 Tax=Paenibacillus flagellatus TaxID=2211139 RepID=A0A2V5KE27_9BACL|nr:pirin family protein [Paenibacillus flagellatus]PYI56293.1 pirin [Paenibacillus flagellatus]
MTIRIYSPSEQGSGAFDGGRITEQKPIGFPGEGGAVKRVGPLFYWAWAFTPVEGYIPPHPHQAFEIMTYVVQGTALHGDSLGTKSEVGPGGAQVMRTGSGVSHEERFIGPDMEGFQIWFEPDLRKSRYDNPAYDQFEHEAFPSEETDGVTVKRVIGGGSPVELTVDARMWDLTLSPGGEYRHPLPAGRSLALLAIRGGGTIGDVPDDATGAAALNQRDFAVIDAGNGTDVAVALRAKPDETLRAIAIEVPTEVDYPLYNKR